MSVLPKILTTANVVKIHILINMLSNLIITQNKFVLIVDNIGLEKHSTKFIQQWLSEQGENAHVHRNTVNLEFNSSSNNNEKHNIILPSISHLFIHQKPSTVFQLIKNLKTDSKVKQVFLWATSSNVSKNFIIPFLEYMADIVVTFKDSNNLSLLIRKPGGLVTNKNYSYKTNSGHFMIEISKNKSNKQTINSNTVKPQDLGTFKIDLDEEELVARNALKLPYEKTCEESQIIYTPDQNDDFDDEDPDEDLYI